MNNSKKKYIRTIFPVMVWLFVFVVLIIYRDSFSIENISSHSPKNPVLAAVVLIMLYGLKTVSMVFPLKVLQLSAGVMFPKSVAILINIIGITISFIVGYGIGRFAGTEYVSKLIRKKPRLAEVLNGQNKNVIIFSCFVRNITFIPLDAGSIYFGASKSPFIKYLVGSILGMLPNVILSTLMGQKLLANDHEDLMTTLVIYFMISVIWMLVYFFYKKSREKQLHNNHNAV